MMEATSKKAKHQDLGEGNGIDRQGSARTRLLNDSTDNTPTQSKAQQSTAEQRSLEKVGCLGATTRIRREEIRIGWSVPFLGCADAAFRMIAANRRLVAHTHTQLPPLCLIVCTPNMRAPMSPQPHRHCDFTPAI